MFYVYKVEIGQYVYVGCTNNLRRRKDQHNVNARLGKSKFGRFLSENAIILHKEDMIVLFALDDRDEALKVEKRTAIDCEKSGMLLLNDNYSKDCTRKGKNIGHTCKRYVIVDMCEHIATEISDLRQYGIKIGIDYRSLHSTINGGFCRNRYKVFTLERWESEKNKDLYLSGEIMKIKKEESLIEMIRKNEKKYIVLTPSNETIEVTNLDKFAREHNINAGNLHSSFNHPTRRASGYKVIKRI